MKPRTLYLFLLAVFLLVVISIKSDISFQMTFGLDIRPTPLPPMVIEKPDTRA